MAQSSWAAYRPGTISSQVVAEMKKINDNKDYKRQKVDSAVYGGIKNTPAAVYAITQALEYHIDYRDKVSKATYENTIKSITACSNQVTGVKQQLGQVQQSIKGLDNSVKSSLNKTEATIIKALKQEAHLIQKVRENMVNMASMGGGKSNIDDGAIRADIKKATKLLKQATTEELRGNRDQILKTLQKRDEAFVKAVADQYKALVGDIAKTLGGQAPAPAAAPAAAGPTEADGLLKDDVIPTLKDEILPILKDDVCGPIPEIQTSIQDLDKKFSPMVAQVDSIDRAVDPLASQVEAITENIEVMGDRFESHREDMNTQLKSNHEALLNVFGANLETIVTSLDDQITQLKSDEAELNAAQTQVVTGLLEDMAEDMKAMRKEIGDLKKEVAALKKKK